MFLSLKPLLLTTTFTSGQDFADDLDSALAQDQENNLWLD